MEIPGEKGYYVLLINVDSNVHIKIGSLGLIKFKKGFYIYIGSACGPGGLRARIRRHLRRMKNPYWHIDYLLMNEHVSINAIWYFIAKESSLDLESLISKNLNNLLDFIKGFGCSDKPSDLSHLYYCGLELYICINILNRILKKYNLTPHIFHTTDLNTS